MLKVQQLHVTAGDQEKTLDTSTPECRVEVKKFIDKHIQGGTALFLERKGKTYRVTGYDEKKDRLLTRVEKKAKEKVAAKTDKGTVTAVPPRSGG